MAAFYHGSGFIPACVTRNSQCRIFRYTLAYVFLLSLRGGTTEQFLG